VLVDNPQRDSGGLPCVDYRTVIRKLVEDGSDLDRTETGRVVDAILDQRFTDLETAATLAALGCKGETADEIAGTVDAILRRNIPMQTGYPDAIDIGGTGGDRAGTFNISTVAAFIGAGAGVSVVKHGNRGVTSACGSADMIAALGVNIERSSTPDQVRSDLAACHFAFVATSCHHRFPPRIGEIRRALGVRSIFNLAGPLVHPAAVRRQVVGVARRAHLPLLADALVKIGREEAFVVHGVDGLDEVSCVGETLIARVRHGAVDMFSLSPRDFGVAPCLLAELAGGDPQRNADICVALLDGERGPRRDAAVVAASTLLVLSGKAETFLDGAAMACNAIDSGSARQVLKKFLGEAQ
jgi:anthranilate phosphoribosyltransferase